MMQFEIKNRYTGAVFYAAGGEALRDVVEAAVRDGAWRDGARLYNNRLVGRRPIIQIGPIGSRSGYLVAYLTDAGVRLGAGCFFGTLDAFRAACAETHGDSIHGREYAAAIAMIESHAALWTPAAEAKEE